LAGGGAQGAVLDGQLIRTTRLQEIAANGGTR